VTVLLITGATGTFGEALVKEALTNWDFSAIRLFSRGEYPQWQMRQRLTDTRIRWMIGDVRDKDRLAACMRGVDYVVHAAALKHVSTGEYNPQEVIKTNVQGSVNVVDVAAQQGVKRVIGISSDKAVNPSCLYGSTKQIMETLFMDANRWAAPATLFSIVRSGNFLESHGNVMELWRQQSMTTGCVTVTDTAMCRFFIPVETVARFTLQRLMGMQGREIFIPKMQEQSIMELAMQTCTTGKVTIIGKGSGERLREPLWGDTEQVRDKGEYYEIRGGDR